jgi:hypothetical protein
MYLIIVGKKKFKSLLHTGDRCQFQLQLYKNNKVYNSEHIFIRE